MTEARLRTLEKTPSSLPDNGSGQQVCFSSCRHMTATLKDITFRHQNEVSCLIISVKCDVPRHVAICTTQHRDIENVTKLEIGVEHAPAPSLPVYTPSITIDSKGASFPDTFS